MVDDIFSFIISRRYVIDSQRVARASASKYVVSVIVFLFIL